MEQTSLEQRLVQFEEYLNSLGLYGNPMNGELCFILYYCLNISVK